MNRSGAAVAMLACAVAWLGNGCMIEALGDPSVRPDAAPPHAPVARTNWAVAATNEAAYLFHGLGPARTAADIARDVYAYRFATRRWSRVGEVPVDAGRLASVAATVGGQVYLFGGYTVSPTGEEASTPEVLRFEPASHGFSRVGSMPVPVDDTVALPWRDRWIVLVSGWHDTANVADVQVFDTVTGAWTHATPWPGAPVFGHAGGLAGDVLVACDGVTAIRGTDGRNRFAMSDECWRGDLDPEAIGAITWTKLARHPGPPLYRAGATGSADGTRIVFAGGSTRAYNFDGIGYDGQPAEPSAAVFRYDVGCAAWQTEAALPVAAMDFRGLVEHAGGFLLFGGMRAGQAVSGEVVRFPRDVRGPAGC